MILVVDDDASVTASVALLLRQAGYAVRTAASPAEALRVLESEGLVELFPHKGVFVRQPSMNEIQEMFEVMGVLEGTCARLTAARMTPAGWRKIERLHQKLETHYAEGDREKYIAVNHVFHALVQELAGNRVLDEVVAKLRQKVALYRHQQIYEDRRFDESIREHREILMALRQRDPDAAPRQARRLDGWDLPPPAGVLGSTPHCNLGRELEHP